jgi:hypothetical protein
LKILLVFLVVKSRLQARLLSGAIVCTLPVGAEISTCMVGFVRAADIGVRPYVYGKEDALRLWKILSDNDLYG